MQPLSQQIHGILYRREDTTALFLVETAPPLFLRFAFVVQGTEKLIFPALLLDDWGREQNTLSLYQWVYEEGQRFPRAELFGFSLAGRETQIFLRDLEIFFKYPCYTYPGRKTPMSAGMRLDLIFIPATETVVKPAPAEIPAEVSWPLRHAAVTWQAATSAALAAAGWHALDPAAGFQG